MGRLVCEKHGEHGSALACDHLRSSPDPLLLGGRRVLWTLCEEQLPGDDSETAEYALCAECASRAAIGSEDAITREDHVHDVLAHLAGLAECTSCEQERWDRSRMPVVRIRAFDV